MAISVGLCTIGLGYWTHDVCVESRKGGFFQEELEQQCIFSTATAIGGISITILEIIIIIVGRMARIPACCCNQAVHPLATPVVVQIPADQTHVYNSSVQGANHDEKCPV